MGRNYEFAKSIIAPGTGGSGNSSKDNLYTGRPCLNRYVIRLIVFVMQCNILFAVRNKSSIPLF